ncbi:hypothetical protein [Sulfitobacter sp. PS-8MA]|uniref:hypothetical protein n=1 Tax=Sulfitobacter sp. PS-8MA TaxID=3237707 RepID=UPI0034C5B22D
MSIGVLVVRDPKKTGPARPGYQDGCGLVEKDKWASKELFSVLTWRILAKVHCMDLRSTYLAFVFFAATLLGWRGFYGVGEFPGLGLGCLGLLGILSLVGGYRVALRPGARF